MAEGINLIVAVDPGKTTGVAAYVDGVGEFSSQELECWQAVEGVAAKLESGLVIHLVSESFVITANTLKKTRGENWSLESIGALRYLAKQHGVQFHLQSPAEGKGFGTDTKLKALGWWKPTEGGHANDAARHLLTFLAKSGRLPKATLEQLIAAAD